MAVSSPELAFGRVFGFGAAGMPDTHQFAPSSHRYRGCVFCGAACFGRCSCACSRFFGILVRGFRDCGGVAGEVASGLDMSCVGVWRSLTVFDEVAVRGGDIGRSA